MKLLIISLALLTSLATLGQDKPKPELVDQFNAANCDELLARVDYFSIRVFQSPESRGLIVISGSNDQLIEKLKLEIPLVYAIRRPGNDVSSKIRIIRGNEAGKALATFWLVPSEAEAPVSLDQAWDLTIPSGTKPYYFFSDSDPICSYGWVFKALRDLLGANPHLRVNAVVGARSSREFETIVADIRRSLGKENARRLKVFRKKEMDYYEPITDFWLLP